MARLLLLILLVALLPCESFFGQAAAPVAQPQTFHVRGTVKDPVEAVVPKIKVTFQADQLTKTVTTNDNGVYEADLPLGEYTMTVQARGFNPYRRPLFRVTSPTNAVLNATLRTGNPCGDMIVTDGSGGPATDEQTEAVSAMCRREDIFTIPTADATKFQLSIRYGIRESNGSRYSYRREKTDQYGAPVLVAYNLFSLQADEVYFDEQSRTLEASGNVIVEDDLDTSAPVQSLTLKMVDGRVERR